MSNPAWLILAALAAAFLMLGPVPAGAQTCPDGAGPGGAAGVCLDSSGLSHAAGTSDVQAGVAALDAAIGTGPACRVVEDEGVVLPDRPTLNFTGSGVVCADDVPGDETDCTIAAGHGIQDEGSGLASRAALNFVGPGLACSDDSGNDRTTCNAPHTNLYDGANAWLTHNVAPELVVLDVDADGKAEVSIGGADNTSVLPGLNVNTDGTGDAELHVERTAGRDVLVSNGLRIGQGPGGQTNQLDWDGTALFFDLDGDGVRDADDRYLHPQLVTADPVDGTDGCARGDVRIRTDVPKLFTCVVSGFPAGSSWYGVALVDAP